MTRTVRAGKRTHLSLDSVSTLLTQVHEVEDTTPQVSERGDTLHLDRVHLLEGVVEDSRGVDDLPPEVLVVHVPDEERLGGKGVGLDVDVRPGDLVDEGRLSDVGVTANEESTGGGVDGRETGHVLSDLLEVGKGILLTTHDGGHSEQEESHQLRPRKQRVAFDSPSKGSLLELLASVQTVSELEQSAVILSDGDDQVSGSVELSKSELVVVLVVEYVEQGGEERVEVLRGERER